jgi:large subunit ribosomal protein L18
MVHGSRYRVQLRRRREQKTDYQARKGFVVSGRARLVARSSLKNTVAQIIIAKPHGDEVLASAHSHELLKKYGWKGATGNIPAAYLTGLLCGLKAKKNGVSAAILDLGLVSPTKGSKVFSTMSGVVDAGIEIPHSPEKIVKDRTRGFHIQDYAETLGSYEEYKPKFSTSCAKGLNPAKFNEHFVEVRNSILTAFGSPIPAPEARTAKPKKAEPKPQPVKGEKPQAKKVEAPAAKAEVKPLSAKKPETAEVAEVKPKVTEAKVPAKVETKPKPKVEEREEEVEVKPKAKASKAKPAAKKAAPAKAKSAKADEAEEETEAPEAKPKRAIRKKAEAEEAKPAKKSGGKKA